MVQKSKAFSYVRLTACMLFAVLLIVMRNEIFRALLPFLLSLLLSAAVKRITRKISKKSRTAGIVISVLIVTASLVVLGIALRLCLSKLFGEVSLLARKINENPQMISGLLQDARDRLASGRFTSHIFASPEATELSVLLGDVISSALKGLASGLLERLSALAINGAAKIPSLVLFLSVFLISAFYFICDDGKITSFLSSLLPSGTKARLASLLCGAKRTLSKYLFSSLLLGLISFLILLVGLSVLGSKYSLFSALLIAVVDFLPILGASFVLLPWSLICFVCGNTKMGVGLLIINVILVLFRQIFEPKILGKSLGLHPLATLFSVYAGVMLMGAQGLVLGPVIAVGIKGFLASKSIDKKA